MIRKLFTTARPHGTALLWLAVSLSACSRDQPGTNAEFKVALLTPGPISDQSWNAGAYQGLLRIRDSLDAKISHIQTRTPAEFDENFRQYGGQRYNLVFGHGFEFQDAALRVAPHFPQTIYITTSGTSTAKNVAGIEFAFEEASYLAGMLAGAMTKTGTIGMIGGTELPPVRRSFASFTLGVRSTNRKATTFVSYIGNWDDVSAGKEQALAQISRNADIIFQNADAAGLGVFQAAKEAKGVRVIGSNSNQNNVAPEVTLGSVVIDLPHAFVFVAREVKDGKFKPRVISLGLHDDIVKLVLNPRLVSAIPPAVLHQIDSAHKALDGQLESASAKQ
jgi:basic membrane lipoprotein Med (substrate-binding protein (PBP1-ABC) superfamily)